MADLLLAIRNLLRNRRRSASTLTALAIGLTAVLLFNGFKANIVAIGLTAVVRTGGHLQVQHRDYFAFGGGNPGAFGIVHYASLLRRIQRDPYLRATVAVATPVIKFGGLAGNFEAGVTRTVLGTGVVAGDVAQMRQWNEPQVPGVAHDFKLLDTPPESAIVGLGVARVLRLCEALGIQHCPKPSDAEAAVSGAALPDDVAKLALTEAPDPAAGVAGSPARVELLVTGQRGAPNVMGLKVVAAEDQVFKELDEVTVILHLDAAQRLLFGRDDRQVTALVLQLKSTADLPRVVDHLQPLLAGSRDWSMLQVRSYLELNPFFAQTKAMFDFIFGFVFVLIGSIVLFTVSNTMNAAVVERTVEIGTLRAMGLRRRGIQRLFLLEGFLLGLCGAAVGVVLAVGLAELINFSGVTWLPPGSSERIPLQLRVLSDADVLVGSAVGMVAIATVSAWWPAWRAAHLEIVEALRHV